MTEPVLSVRNLHVAFHYKKRVMTIRKAGTAVPGDEKEDGKGSHAEKGEGAV